MRRTLTPIVALLCVTAMAVPFVALGATTTATATTADNDTTVIADWEDNDINPSATNLGDWTGDTGMLSVESTNPIDGSYSLNSTTSSTVKNSEAVFDSAQSPDTVSVEMRVDQITGNSNDNVNLRFFDGSTDSPSSNRVFEIRVTGGNAIQFVGDTGYSIGTATLGESFTVNVTQIDWDDNEAYVEINGEVKGPYPFANGASGYDRVSILNVPNDGTGQNSLVVDDLFHNLPTSLDERDWSFENQPADSGNPHDWQDANVGTGAVNVTTMTADDGDQSLLLSESSGSNSIGTELTAPFPNNITTDVSASLYKSDAVSDGDGAGQIAMELFEGDTRVIDVGVNETGYLQYVNSTGAEVPITFVGLNDWSRPTIESIDAAADTYDVRVGGVLEEDVPMANPMTSGYNQIRIFADTRGLVDDIEVAYGTDTTGDISGVVRDDSGDPVSNATVRVNSVNFNSLTGTIEEKREQAQAIRDNIDQTPDAWKDVENTDVTEFFEPDTGYVAVHPPEAYGLENVRYQAYSYQIPNLAPDDDRPGPYGPTDYAPAGETLLVSVWGPDNSVFQDGFERALPGGVQNDEAIIVERLVPGGVDETQRVPTSETYDVDNSLEDHDYGVTQLSAGYYRIYPEGSPESSYVLPVGPADQRLSGWQTAVSERAAGLNQSAERLQEYINNNTIDSTTVTTDANGRYSVNLPSGAGSATLLAYRVPDAVGVDAANATPADAREYYDSLDLDTVQRPPSMFASAGSETVSPPASNVTLRTTEVSAARATNISQLQNLTSQIESLVTEYGYGNLPRFLRGSYRQLQAGNLSPEEKRELYNSLEEYITQNPAALERARENLEDCINRDCEGDLKLDDPANATAGELQERLEAMQESLTNLQEQIEAEDTTTTVGDGTLSATAEFASAIDPEGVLVKAQYSNGTSTLVPDEYVTIDQSATSTLPGVDGTTTISVEDYPIGETDPASVSFAFEVANSEGVGSTTTGPVRNPAFSGTIPNLDAVRISSMEPETGDSLTIEARPGDAQGYRQTESVTVYEPDGDQRSATLTNESATFTPTQTGPHTVELKYSNVGGTNFTRSFRVQAVGQGIDRPPTLRTISGPTGTYALASDGLLGGEVESQNGRLNVATQLSREAEMREVRVYTAGIPYDRKQETSIRVTRGENSQTVSERVRVALHGPRIGDEGHVYRKADETDPLPRDGGSYGQTSVMSNGTLVETVTGPDGAVVIETNSDPTFVEGAVYDYYRIVGIDIPLLSLGPAGLGIAGLGLVVPVGLLGVLARRRSRGDTQ